MANISKLKTPRSLTTDFKSIFFPLYRASETLRSPSQQAGVVPKIGQLALNIYSPTIKIPQYENLLCQEMGGRQDDYDSHQSVKSFWFSGSPLKQLSPEAITELCFRFSNHFPHSDELNTVRGISARASELNAGTLALLAGLKFNCLEVYIDALIASDDRSLGKVEKGLGLIADYKQIKLNFKIGFGDHTHPDYLMRLLTLLEGANSQQVELVCKKTRDLNTTSNSTTAEQQLLEINKYFALRGWLSCGNNIFYSPQHENNELYENRKLLLTPWGYTDQATQTQLGVGVGALSLIDNSLDLNTVNPEGYQKSINERQLLPTTQFTLDPLQNPLVQLAQNLVCYHQISTVDNNDLSDNKKDYSGLFTALINHGSMEPVGDTLKLTDKGLLNLIAISKFLFSQINNEDYNSDSIQNH
jgi:hypothetical protein